jgi:hypothetical protein
MKNLIIEDSESGSTTGGATGCLYNWDPGNKLMWVHDLLVRRSAEQLVARAVARPITSTDRRGQHAHGQPATVAVEASIGPITIQRNTFRDNGRFESYRASRV